MHPAPSQLQNGRSLSALGTRTSFSPSHSALPQFVALASIFSVSLMALSPRGRARPLICASSWRRAHGRRRPGGRAELRDESGALASVDLVVDPCGLGSSLRKGARAPRNGGGRLAVRRYVARRARGSAGNDGSRRVDPARLFLRENRESRESLTVDGAVGRIGKAGGRTPMMDDTRKSDGPVVPAKPSNKAEPSAAEGVEGWREGARPSSLSPHRRRAASGRVPQASEERRIRSRRRDVGAIRGEPGGQPPRSPRTTPSKSVSGETLSKGIHPQGRAPHCGGDSSRPRAAPLA